MILFLENLYTIENIYIYRVHVNLTYITFLMVLFFVFFTFHFFFLQNTQLFYLLLVHYPV